MHERKILTYALVGLAIASLLPWFFAAIGTVFLFDAPEHTLSSFERIFRLFLVAGILLYPISVICATVMTLKNHKWIWCLLPLVHLAVVFGSWTAVDMASSWITRNAYNSTAYFCKKSISIQVKNDSVYMRYPFGTSTTMTAESLIGKIQGNHFILESESPDLGLPEPAKIIEILNNCAKVDGSLFLQTYSLEQ